MKHEELVALQDKVDELQAVLLFAKRAIPFLEDIFAFVKNIIPLVEVMRASVDATAEKLPKASKQLDTVTHATEVASTEILNTLETMFATIERMMFRHRERQAQADRIDESLRAIDRAFDTLDHGLNENDQLRTLQELWASYRMPVQAVGDASLESLQRLQGDCTSIMMALQVQDITAQQIAAVNRMMQSVDEGLNRLMRHFADVPAERDPGGCYSHAHLDIQFDVDANYFGAGGRQEAADALVARAQQPNGSAREGAGTDSHQD